MKSRDAGFYFVGMVVGMVIVCCCIVWASPKPINQIVADTVTTPPSKWS